LWRAVAAGPRSGCRRAGNNPNGVQLSTVRGRAELAQRLRARYGRGEDDAVRCECSPRLGRFAAAPVGFPHDAHRKVSTEELKPAARRASAPGPIDCRMQSAPHQHANTVVRSPRCPCPRCQQMPPCACDGPAGKRIAAEATGAWQGSRGRSEVAVPDPPSASSDSSARLAAVPNPRLHPVLPKAQADDSTRQAAGLETKEFESVSTRKPPNGTRNRQPSARQQRTASSKGSMVTKSVSLGEVTASLSGP
jgi:hypothetical protein